MEGGNEATNGSGITHSPERRTKRPKRAYQNDEVENALWMDSALGVLLDGSAGGEAPLPIRAAARLPKPAPVGRFAAEASKNLFRSQSPFVSLDRGCVSRRNSFLFYEFKKFFPLTDFVNLRSIRLVV